MSDTIISINDGDALKQLWDDSRKVFLVIIGKNVKPEILQNVEDSILKTLIRPMIYTLQS